MSGNRNGYDLIQDPVWRSLVFPPIQLECRGGFFAMPRDESDSIDRKARKGPGDSKRKIKLNNTLGL